MAKKARQLGGNDSRQLSLLELLQQQADELRQPSADEGSLDIHGRLCRALSAAIKKSGRGRFEIAGRMGHLLGQEITVHQLNAWTAEAKEAHRIPAEYLPAFCAACNDFTPLQILTDAGGLFCLPGPEALRAEIQKLREEERKVGAQRRRREAFLKEMEGDQ